MSRGCIAGLAEGPRSFPVLSVRLVVDGVGYLPSEPSGADRRGVGICC